MHQGAKHVVEEKPSILEKKKQTLNASRALRGTLSDNKEHSARSLWWARRVLNTPRAERKLNARAARPFRTAHGDKAATTTESPAKQLSGSAPSLGNKLPTEAEKALI
ncbi:hypothetical protein NDU88_001497 [Pleurodeles waltl]|uniref:Uncharacterized protein n=1 Tax=Pleurodeles waltl TaxID=8319 RepID=A0AAV7SCV4_PLEWA|nr:hypothetical protein NDU88_001497 [Pleurodeles waltl]